MERGLRSRQEVCIVSQLELHLKGGCGVFVGVEQCWGGVLAILGANRRKCSRQSERLKKTILSKFFSEKLECWIF